jgi:excisionase family DNA binding protein
MLPPLTISFKQAAQMLNVSSSSVRRQAAAGRVATIRVGRRKLVVMDSLREFVKPAAK